MVRLIVSYKPRLRWVSEMLKTDLSSHAYVVAPDHRLDGALVELIKRNPKTVTVRDREGNNYRVPWQMLVSRGVREEGRGR